MGHKLGDASVGLPTQDEVKTTGFAMQCRVTTEDPINQFRPDYGRITHYRSAGGMGIRLDAAAHSAERWSIRSTIRCWSR